MHYQKTVICQFSLAISLYNISATYLLPNFRRRFFLPKRYNVIVFFLFRFQIIVEKLYINTADILTCKVDA